MDPVVKTKMGLKLVEVRWWCRAFVPYRPVLARFDHQGVKIEDGIDISERVALPGHDFFLHRRSYIGDECERNFHPVKLFQMPLDFPGGKAPGIECQNLLIETFQPSGKISRRLQSPSHCLGNPTERCN